MLCDFHTHCRSGSAAELVSSSCKSSGFWSLELHPWHLPLQYSGLPDDFTDLLKAASAVGEVGLDRLKGPALDVQIKYFSSVLALAQEYHKPVVIHAVRCIPELDRCLKAFSGNVLIHGFRGGADKLRHHLSLGRWVSFAPGAWKQVGSLLAENDALDHIGLETDDSGLAIADVYRAAELESGISGWEQKMENSFRSFLGISKEESLL